MDNYKIFKPIFEIPFGEGKLFLDSFCKADEKEFTSLIISMKIEEGKHVPPETIINDGLFAYASLTFKSKEAITNIITVLEDFRDNFFGKTAEDLEREQNG